MFLLRYQPALGVHIHTRTLTSTMWLVSQKRHRRTFQNEFFYSVRVVSYRQIQGRRETRVSRHLPTQYFRIYYMKYGPNCFPKNFYLMLAYPNQKWFHQFKYVGSFFLEITCTSHGFGQCTHNLRLLAMASSKLSTISPTLTN